MMAHDVETKLRNLWLAEYDDLPELVADDFMHADQADAGPATPQREDGGERTLLDERIDDLTVDHLQQRPDESNAPSEQKRWRGGVVAVAATILVVVGVVVVADGNSGDVVTDPASTPILDDPVPYRWSRVPHDEAVFGGEFEQGMFDVTAGGPGFVAVGHAGPGPNGEEGEGRAAVWTSVDGIDWSRVPHTEAVFGDARMSSITAGGPGLVAVGSATEEGHGVAAVWTSVDGIDWSRVSHDEAVFGEPAFHGLNMTSVTVGGPGLVAVGGEISGQGATSNAVVWTSPDGVTWSRVPHNEATFGREEVNRCCTEMRSVTAAGSGLVAVGLDVSSDGENERAAVWTSVDGIDWSRVPHDEAILGAAWMNSVTTGGPGLVAVGSATLGGPDSVAAVWTSPDGVTWFRVPHDEAVFAGEEAPPACCTEMRSVTTGGAGLVAVGSDFTRSVAAANGGWVIAGVVWTSVDGTVWSRFPHDEAVFEAPPRPNLEMSSVTAGGPGLVAVGANTVHDFWATHNDSGESDAVVWVATLED